MKLNGIKAQVYQIRISDSDPSLCSEKCKALFLDPYFCKRYQIKVQKGLSSIRERAPSCLRDYGDGERGVRTKRVCVFCDETVMLAGGIGKYVRGGQGEKSATSWAVLDKMVVQLMEAEGWVKKTLHHMPYMKRYLQGYQKGLAVEEYVCPTCWSMPFPCPSCKKQVISSTEVCQHCNEKIPTLELT